MTLFSACSHRLNHTEIDRKNQKFNDVEKGFYALAEKELKANKAASKPELKIERVWESKSELKIKYELKYNETFSDGEFIQRRTTGTAVLKKNYASSEEEWVLDSIEDANQTMIFKQGSKLGT